MLLRGSGFRVDNLGWHAASQVRTARSQWLAEEEGGIDDCTAIVCVLQQGSRPRRTGSMLPTDAAKAASAISRSPDSSFASMRTP